jgi:plastocyanin
MIRYRIVAPIMISSFAAACGSSTDPQSRSSNVTVNATPSIAFTPRSVTLATGGTMTFVFGALGHNVFFDNDPAGAPATIDGVNMNTSVQRTFATAGTYTYNCHIHPGMRGTVVVGSGSDTNTNSSGYGGY